MLLKFAECKSLSNVEEVFQEEMKRIKSEEMSLRKIREIFTNGLKK